MSAYLSKLSHGALATPSPGHLESWHSVTRTWQWQAWHMRVRTPLQWSAVTFSCVIWTHLFVWYLDSILRASNAILRVTEQARSMEGWSEIEWYQYICCLLCAEENIFLHLISLLRAAVSDVYLGEPPVMSISDFCLDFLSCVDIPGQRGYIIIFQEILHNQSHVYHSKSKERNLVQETFMKRIKIHFFSLIQFNF